MRLIKPSRILQIIILGIVCWSVLHFDDIKRYVWVVSKNHPLDLHNSELHKDDNIYKENFKITHLSNNARNIVEENKIAAGSHLENLATSKVIDNNSKPSVLDLLISQRKDNKMSVLGRMPGDGSYDCDSWKLSKHWTSPSSPQIVLNPNQFIYPGVSGGPNNQIVAFKQAVYLAIRLNRTLVLPTFYSYKGVGTVDISPHERIDVNRLCSFVSCISIEEQKKKCGNEFDVAFKAKIPSINLIHWYERQTKLLIHDKTKVMKIPGSTKLRLSNILNILDIPSLPANDSQITYKSWLTSDEATLRKTYNTDAPCAVYITALGSIELRPTKVAIPLQNFNQGISNISDITLYSAISNAIWCPPCIIDTAAEYVRSVLGKFVGAHWRYDFLDWCRNGTRKNKPELTNWVLRITPEDLAQSLIERLKIKNKRTIFVYLAMPPILENFKNETYANLSALNPLFQKPKVDLKEFISGRVTNCWKINKWSSPGEIFSLLEMEIMRKSQRFFFSPGSSWSSNIREQRVLTLPSGKAIRKFELSIFEGAKKVAQNRIKKQVKKKPNI